MAAFTTCRPSRLLRSVTRAVEDPRAHIRTVHADGVLSPKTERVWLFGCDRDYGACGWAEPRHSAADLGRIGTTRNGTRMRPLTSLAAAVAFLWVLAGCSPGEAGVDATPNASTSSAPASASPSPSVPSWQAKYSAREVAAYEAALDVWERYQRDSEPFWAKGRSTPAAEDVFRRYWVPWQVMNDLLARFEASDVRVEGLGRVLWSKPVRVSVGSRGGGSITIRQCVSGRGIRTYQGGKLLTPSTSKPQFRSVEMAGYPEGSSVRWLILQETGSKGDSPCPA
jgi:hypothetical protein